MSKDCFYDCPACAALKEMRELRNDPVQLEKEYQREKALALAVQESRIMSKDTNA